MADETWRFHTLGLVLVSCQWKGQVGTGGELRGQRAVYYVLVLTMKYYEVVLQLLVVYCLVRGVTGGATRTRGSNKKRSISINLLSRKSISINLNRPLFGVPGSDLCIVSPFFQPLLESSQDSASCPDSSLCQIPECTMNNQRALADLGFCC